MDTIQNAQLCQEAASYYASAGSIDGINSDLSFVDTPDMNSLTRPKGCSFSASRNEAVQRYGAGGECTAAGYDGCFCKVRKAYVWFNREVTAVTARERCSKLPNGQLATFSSVAEYFELAKTIMNGDGSHYDHANWFGRYDGK